jgi:SAM-dependent methyltransferase
MPEHLESNSTPYYQHERYWNALPSVIRYMNRRASGDPGVDWMHDLRQRRGQPFERALVLNCGDGWVERAMLEADCTRTVVATDISAELLEFARGVAIERDLPITYVLGDVNQDPLPLEGVDLVVNHAAAHHITHLDHVLAAIADALPDDGWFVSFDYVGPHRNQYPLTQWDAMAKVNDRLPRHLQSQMHYPHLPTMLVADPTEAVHSELFLEVHDRWFTTVVDRRIGGWLAYPLITHNQGIFDNQSSATDRWIDEIIAADEAAVEADPANTLFAYLISTPRRPGLSAAEREEAFAAEDARELAAAADGGRYYPRTIAARLSEKEVAFDSPEEAVHRIPGRLLARHLVRRIQPVRRTKRLAINGLRWFRRSAFNAKKSTPNC